jgi:hypothetical protein
MDPAARVHGSVAEPLSHPAVDDRARQIGGLERVEARDPGTAPGNRCPPHIAAVIEPLRSMTLSTSIAR